MKLQFNPFKGRINRGTFFVGMLIGQLLFFGIVRFSQSEIFLNPFTQITAFLLYIPERTLPSPLSGYVSLIIFIIEFIIVLSPYLIFVISLMAKRLHDLGGAGWIAPVLLFFCALANIFTPGLLAFIFIASVIGPLLFIKGKKEKNHYGTPPLPLINILSLFGFYILKNEVNQKKSHVGNSEDKHDTTHVLTQVLTLTLYKEDNDAFIQKFIMKSEKKVLYELLPTLPEVKQNTLKKDLASDPDAIRVHELLLTYFSPLSYEDRLNEIVQNNLSKYIKSVYPSLRDEQKKELDAYLASL